MLPPRRDGSRYEMRAMANRRPSRRSRPLILMPRVIAVLAVVAVLPLSGCAARHAKRTEEGRLPPNQAWFARQRMSSGEPIPPDAAKTAMRAWRQSRGAAHPATPGAWVSVGPSNLGGRLTALAVDPHDPDHGWAGAAAGGVFESRDAGSTWTPVFDDQLVRPIGALAAHPTNSDIL